jgi:hypothetical protein
MLKATQAQSTGAQLAPFGRWGDETAQSTRAVARPTSLLHHYAHGQA